MIEQPQTLSPYDLRIIDETGTHDIRLADAPVEHLVYAADFDDAAQELLKTNNITYLPTAHQRKKSA